MKMIYDTEELFLIHDDLVDVVRDIDMSDGDTIKLNYTDIYRILILMASTYSTGTLVRDLYLVTEKYIFEMYEDCCTCSPESLDAFSESLYELRRFKQVYRSLRRQLYGLELDSRCHGEAELPLRLDPDLIDIDYDDDTFAVEM